MSFDNTQKELYSYISASPIWRIFIPISEVLFVGGAILLLLTFFGFLNVGFLVSIFMILTIVGLVVTLAKGNYQMLMIGLAIITLYDVLRFLFRGFGLGNLLYALCGAYFTFMAYKKINKLS